MTLVLHQREEGTWQRAGKVVFFGSADFENWPFRERDGTSTATAVAAGDSVNAITTGARAAAAAASTFAKLPTPLRQALPPPAYLVLSRRCKKCMSLGTLQEENIHCLFSPSSSRVWGGSAPPSSLPGFYFGKLQPGKMGKRNGQSELLASSCMTMKINLGRNGRRVGGAVRGARSAGLATTN